MSRRHGSGASVDLHALQSVMGSSLIWVGVAFLMLMAFLFRTIRLAEITGEEVGVQLHRISGKLTVVNQSGVKIYNGLLSDFYKIRKTIHILEMTERIGQGERPDVRDDLKVKTIDGSDVYVDLKIQYRIDPNMADEVVLSSGPGEGFTTKWARDYVRAITRNYLGALTTEEFYDPSKRDARVLAAKKEINTRLQPFGILIDQISIPQRPHFYEEYEEMIKRKKEADQAVQEQMSKALAAKQKQMTMLVQETNRMNVAIEEFEGQMEQLVIDAKAQDGRARKEADAYYEQNTIAAGAGLYKLKNEAEGILAAKEAEAAGIMALKKALEGEGGRNMVKLEYARKLKGIQIMGRPYTVDGRLERFEHLRGAETAGAKK